MAKKQTSVDILTNLNKEHGPFEQVLDLGCGDRVYEDFITSCKYIGLDVEVSGRAPGNKKADIFYDGLTIPFKDSQFDLIICTEVLEHSNEPEILLREMKRCLRPDGKIYLSSAFVWGENEQPFDFHRYTQFGWKKLFKKNNLTISLHELDDQGAKALFKLAFSEVKHGSNNVFQRLVAFTWLSLSYFFIDKIFRINMERIYTSNCFILEKGSA